MYREVSSTGLVQASTPRTSITVGEDAAASESASWLGSEHPTRRAAAVLAQTSGHAKLRGRFDGEPVSRIGETFIVAGSPQIGGWIPDFSNWERQASPQALLKPLMGEASPLAFVSTQDAVFMKADREISSRRYIPENGDYETHPCVNAAAARGIRCCRFPSMPNR